MRVILMMTVALSMAMAETTMVKDPTTNLIWEDTNHTTEEKVTHNEATTYCSTLKLGEVSDWRVPTLNELLTIVDYTRYEPATLKEFSHVEIGTMYWTSTPYLRSKDQFWGIEFKDGATDSASKNYNRYVRCVKASK